MNGVVAFVVVGCSAAATHFLMVAALVHVAALSPLIANVPAFLVAFCVSFIGHWRLSFRRQNARWKAALPRFAVVASVGFVLNELLYAVLLRLLGDERYLIALVFTLAVVAVLTYVLSRWWAFASKAMAS